MRIARERVVPPPPDRSWLKFALLGASIGILMGLAIPPLSKWATERALLSSPNISILFTILYVLFAGLVLFPLPILFRVTQRWTICLAFSTATIIAMTITAEALSALAHGDGGADIPAWLDSDELIGIAIFVPSYILIAVILRLIYRFLLVRTIEHSDGLCAWCGYTLGSVSITRCPECGRNAYPPRFRSHFFVTGILKLARCWLPVALLALLALVIGTAPPIVRKTIPSARFYRAFPGGLRMARYNPNSYIWPDLPSVWIPHPSLDDRGLRITYEPATRGRPVHMSIDVTGTPATGYSFGAGHVITDLNADQSSHVIAHGLPDALIKALYAKADEIAWTPSSVARGAWEVDAAPLFPK